MNDLLEKTIKNFQQQYKLYVDMMNLAEKQLQYIEQQGVPSSEQLLQLIQERQTLLQAINELNEKNRFFQNQITRELGLDAFVIRNLEGMIDEAYFRRLQEVISQLGLLLERIDASDQQSHRMLGDGLKARYKKAAPKNTSTRANRAYKQAMENTKKPK